MTFIAINVENDYDPSNKNEHATQEQAEAAARERLKMQPTSVIQIAQVLKVFRATVTVTEEAPAIGPEEAAPVALEEEG